MKHKTAELEGALLDAAVAKAEGWRLVDDEWRESPSADDELGALVQTVDAWQPSTEWQDGGPIIERERIAIWRYDETHGEQNCWNAMVGGVHGWDDGGIVAGEEPYGRVEIVGPTPLIAAMRAYVASKFGDEVELP